MRGWNISIRGMAFLCQTSQRGLGLTLQSCCRRLLFLGVMAWSWWPLHSCMSESSRRLLTRYTRCMRRLMAWLQAPKRWLAATRIYWRTGSIRCRPCRFDTLLASLHPATSTITFKHSQILKGAGYWNTSTLLRSALPNAFSHYVLPIDSPHPIRQASKKSVVTILTCSHRATPYKWPFEWISGLISNARQLSMLSCPPGHREVEGGWAAGEDAHSCWDRGRPPQHGSRCGRCHRQRRSIRGSIRGCPPRSQYLLCGIRPHSSAHASHCQSAAVGSISGTKVRPGLHGHINHLNFVKKDQV